MKETLMTPIIYPERAVMQRAAELTLNPQNPRLERRGDIVIMEPPKDESRPAGKAPAGKEKPKGKQENTQQKKPQETRQKERTQQPPKPQRLESYEKDLEARKAQKPVENWTPRDWQDEIKRAHGVMQQVDADNRGQRERRELWEQIQKEMFKPLLEAWEKAVQVKEKRSLTPEEVEQFLQGKNPVNKRPEVDIGYDPYEKDFAEIPPRPPGQEAPKWTANDIQNPDLRAVVHEIEQKIGEKPLQYWSLEELKKAAADLHFATAKALKTAHTAGKFGDREQVAGDMLQYGNPIQAEIDKRIKLGVVEQKEWDKFSRTLSEAVQQAGYDVKLGPGAADITERYANASLRALVDSFNDEVARVNREEGPDAEVDVGFMKDIWNTMVKAIADGRYPDDPDQAREFMRTLRERIARVERAERERREEEERRARERQERREEQQQRAAEQRDEYGIFGQRPLREEDKEAIQRLIDGGTIRINRGKPDEREEPVVNHVNWLFNRIFDRVDARPREIFDQSLGSEGNYEFSEFLRELNAARDKEPDPQRKEQFQNYIRQYSNEFQIRKATHNMNYVVTAGIGVDKLREFADQFQASLVDQATRVEGVTAAMHFYEQALLKVRAKYGGYIPEKSVVTDYMQPGMAPDAARARTPANELPQPVIEGGIMIGEVEWLTYNYLTRFNPEMQDWEKRRAISLARGLNIVTARTIEILADTILPPDSQYVAIFGQNIISEVYPIRHGVAKYDSGGWKKNFIFAYKLGKGAFGWDKKELQEFLFEGNEKKSELQLQVINGLVGEDEERLFSVVNPFRVGGVFTETGWRYKKNQITSALAEFLRMPVEEFNALSERDRERELDQRLRWIGTGLKLELLRGELASHDRKKSDHAKDKAKILLRQIADTSPLKIYMFDRHVRESVANSNTYRRRPELLQKDIDSLVIAQEKFQSMTDSQKNARTFTRRGIRRYSLNFEELPEAERAGAERLANIIRRRFINDTSGEMEDRGKAFIENMKHKSWRVPFVWGTDDVPYNRYMFEQTGANTFSRRLGDMQLSKEAGKVMQEKLMSNMDKFHSSEEIVEVLREMHGIIAQNDADVAKDVVAKLAEGVLKFYSKDWFNRLPLGVGTLLGATSGKMSFAQLAYGRHAMAWEEIANHDFIRRLEEHGIITELQKEYLEKRTGASVKREVAAFARTAIPLLLLAFMLYVASRVKDEK